MKVRSSKGNLFERHKYQPSGIIIVWLGNDDKIHTQSIPNRQTFMGWRQVELDTNMELLLHQLGYLGGEIKSMPMVTVGLTRLGARQALTNLIANPVSPTPPRHQCHRGLIASSS